MTFFRLSVCAAIFVGPFLAASTPHPLPFTIEASEDVSARFPGAPQLQSFAWAECGDSGEAERSFRKESERHSGMIPNTFGA